MDGKCCGAIVNYFYKKMFGNNVPDIDFRPINYKDVFPLDDIGEGDKVYILDFSLEIDVMDKLVEKTRHVIWIDHHISTAVKYQFKIAEYEEKGVNVILDISKAACQLTWEHFEGECDEDDIPVVIKYLADYDLWKFDFGEYTKAFQLYTSIENTHPTSDIWEEWLTWNKIHSYASDLGFALKQYEVNKNEDFCNQWAFYAKLKGLRAICCNVRSGSQFFDSVDPETYDICVPFVYDGKKYTVSLYANHERGKNIDCSKIAESFNGGGHRGAAGFQCEKLPLVYLEKYNPKKER